MFIEFRWKEDGEVINIYSHIEKEEIEKINRFEPLVSDIKSVALASFLQVPVFEK
jgi:hypothetical protein